MGLKLTKKQKICFDALNDGTTNYILFGGSVASGKTRLAMMWAILNCMKYDGVRILVGRSRLTNLKKTTLKTFFDVMLEWKLMSEINMNNQSNIITFKNGSEILLYDLFHYPSDPYYTSLGSLELTAAIIDEAAEVGDKAYQILKTRLRYKLNEFNLIPKLLIVSNPTRNWLYDEFYVPSRDDNLEDNKCFIQAYPHDNPFNSKPYLESLETLPEAEYERLVKGNWEYDESEFALFYYDSLNNAYYTEAKPNGVKYLSVDVADSGSDKTIICYWNGLNLVDIKKLEYSKDNNTNKIINYIKDYIRENQINISNVIIDSVGVGRGVYNGLRGSKEFVANAKCFKNEHFMNLKGQCYYKLAHYLSENRIKIITERFRDDLITELLAHKKFNVDKDGKAEVTRKVDVKKAIRRSPDISDAVMMRMYFEYKKSTGVKIHRIR